MEAPTSLVGAFLAKKSPVDNPFSIKLIYKNDKKCHNKLNNKKVGKVI